MGGRDWETLRYGTERDGSTTWELGEKGTMEIRERWDRVRDKGWELGNKDTGPEREGVETERDGVGAGREEGGNQEERARGFASLHA